MIFFIPHETIPVAVAVDARSDPTVRHLAILPALLASITAAWVP